MYIYMYIYMYELSQSISQIGRYISLRVYADNMYAEAIYELDCDNLYTSNINV